MRRLVLTLALLGTATSACDCGGGNDLSQLTPDLAVSPSPLIFDTVPLGVTATAAVTLTNQGDFRLDVRALRLEEGSHADFVLQEAEPLSTLQPGESADVVVRFTPSALGAAEGALLVDSSDPDSPTVRVPILATRRQGPVLVMCVESLEIPLLRRCGRELGLDYGAVPVGEFREAVVELRSEGTDPLLVASVGFSGDSHPAFGLTQTSTGTLAPGEFIRVPVFFKAGAAGEVSGALQVASNDGPRAVPLAARGAESALCVRPSFIDLGAAPLEGVRTGTITAANCGDTDLTITEAVVLGGPGPFSLVRPLTRPVTLPAIPGVGLATEVRFAPTTLGEHEARVRFTSDRGVSVVTVRGIGAECELEVAPTELVFDVNNPFRSLLVTNNGVEACRVARIHIPDDGMGTFTIVSAPVENATVEPGQAVQVDVATWGRPIGLGADRLIAPPPPPEDEVRGRLEVVYGEDGDSVLSVPLLNRPFIPPGPCLLAATPTALQFGTQAPGVERAIGLELGANGGGGRCTITSMEFVAGSDAAFSIEAPADLVLDPWEVASVKVWFRPARGGGQAAGTIRVAFDGETSGTIDVPVSGFANAPTLCVTPGHLDFGPTQVAAQSSVQLTACGSRAVTVTAVDWLTPDPELSVVTALPFPLLLAPGESRAVEIGYAPADAVGDTAVLRVASDDPGRPTVEVRVTGGAQVVPPEAGRFLYYWQIFGSGLIGIAEPSADRAAPPIPPGPGDATEGEITRMPLQGSLVPEAFFGRRTGRACGGCHSVSPDGRYVALVEMGGAIQTRTLRVIDTQSNLETLLPAAVDSGLYVSWKPDVNADPPYQFVFASADGDIALSSLYAGYIGKLGGADAPDAFETMPSWGPNGTIVFTRTNAAGGIGIAQGELWTVPETGGVAAPLAGASGDTASRYYPAFSRNGRWVAYTHSASGNSSISAADARLEVVAADGSGLVLTYPDVNAPGSPNSHPTWSIDGRFLSFASKRPGGAGNWDVYLVSFDPETGSVGPVVPIEGLNTPDYQHAAQWSP
jgi:hypothetical protein